MWRLRTVSTARLRSSESVNNMHGVSLLIKQYDYFMIEWELSDGCVDRVSASGMVDLSSIPSSLKLKVVKQFPCSTFSNKRQGGKPAVSLRLCSWKRQLQDYPSLEWQTAGQEFRNRKINMKLGIKKVEFGYIDTGMILSLFKQSLTENILRFVFSCTLKFYCCWLIAMLFSENK